MSIKSCSKIDKLAVKLVAYTLSLIIHEFCSNNTYLYHQNWKHLQEYQNSFLGRQIKSVKNQPGNAKGKKEQAASGTCSEQSNQTQSFISGEGGPVLIRGEVDEDEAFEAPFVVSLDSSSLGSAGGTESGSPMRNLCWVAFSLLP